MNDRKIICLTPVKNEAWILDFFIRSASIWADHIIIADQKSTDGSAEIAKKYEKVILIKNESEKFNEPERQQMLIAEARKIEGDHNVFIALDADEVLIGFDNNPEWEQFKNCAPGTIMWLPWLNVLPGLNTYYSSRGGGQLFGYINDKKEHIGSSIHSLRLPFGKDSEQVAYGSLKVLHFQYADKGRLLSKHRWYECLEKIKFPDKNNIDIYRIYHHIDLPVNDIGTIDSIWLDIYKANHIFVGEINMNAGYWWDKEICIMFDTYGVERFRKQAIWDLDWKIKYQYYFSGKDSSHIIDPRNFFDKWVHGWLRKSQVDRFSFGNKVANKLLRIIRW